MLWAADSPSSTIYLSVDATAIARLKDKGMIVIGRTNMTEFAYSGIGINPHYGTPKGAWQRNVGHVPGGSSSGAAVSIADGMAYGALGTDTGGSCRIPAAYNGIVGYKPTQSRVPLEGGVPRLAFKKQSDDGKAKRSVQTQIAQWVDTLGLPSTPTSELHGITVLKIKIPVAISKKEQTKSGRLWKSASAHSLKSGAHLIRLLRMRMRSGPSTHSMRRSCRPRGRICRP